MKTIHYSLVAVCLLALTQVGISNTNEQNSPIQASPQNLDTNPGLSSGQTPDSGSASNNNNSNNNSANSSSNDNNIGNSSGSDQANDNGDDDDDENSIPDDND